MLPGGWDAYAVASVAACESHAMLVGLPSPVQDEADKAPADWAERLVDAVVGTASCIAYLHDVCRDLAEQTGIEPAKVEAALMGWAADGLLRVHLPVVALCHGKLANHRARAIYIARTAQSRSVIDA
jgi:hypothetical protein